MDAQIRRWLKVSLEAALEADQRAFLNPDLLPDFSATIGLTPREGAIDLLERDAELKMEEWRNAYNGLQWEATTSVANRLISDYALPIEIGSADYRLFCNRLALATAEIHATRMEHLRGNVAYDPLGEGGSFPPATAGKPPSPTGESIEETVKAYINEKERVDRLDYKARRKLVRALELFSGWVGPHTPVELVTKRQVGDFRSALTRCPLNHAEKFPGLTLKEILDKTEHDDLPRLKTATRQSYLTAVSGFFDWCESGGRIDHNPATDVRVLGGEAGDSYEPFTHEHLDRIFHAPVFTGCKSERYVFVPGNCKVRDWRYWVPLVGLFTGARLGEICQLYPSEVREIDGVWCFQFQNEDGRSLKTDAAVRNVPVHSELIRLGFIDFVRHRQTTGDKMLMPNLPPPVKGYWSHYPTRWFATLLVKALGAEVKGHRELVFHSFRHTMKDAMRDAEIEERLQDRLIGHKNTHVSERYGKGPKPPQLLAAMSKIKLPVDLSHLEPWAHRAVGLDDAA